MQIYPREASARVATGQSVLSDTALKDLSGKLQMRKRIGREGYGDVFEAWLSDFSDEEVRVRSYSVRPAVLELL